MTAPAQGPACKILPGPGMYPDAACCDLRTRKDPMTDTMHDLDISEVLDLLPEGCDWRIINGETASVTTASGRPALLYWDDQDQDNTGWAYRLTATEDDPEESGQLDTVSDLVNVFA